MKTLISPNKKNAPNDECPEMTCCFHRVRTPARSAFTLIEIILVVALLALIAGMIMPRLSGRSYRQAQVAAEEIADLLTLFAHRESMGHDNIAIAFDEGSGAVMLLELVGDPTLPDDLPRWEMDRYVSPVRLPEDMTIAGVREDDVRIDDRSWRIAVIAAQGRPTIEITLTSPDLEVTVSLPSYALSAELLYPGDRANTARHIVDLDQQGLDREIW